MNHTYASPSPTDSDIDSLPSTPSIETPPTIKRNAIKDLILNFEQKNSLEPKSLQVKQQQQIKMQNGNKEENVQENVEEKKKFKAQLNRTLTDIRKNYVRRVCSTLKKKIDVEDETKQLFECCMLVGLNVATLTPYFKNKFPADYEVPPWVEHLCFPDASDWHIKQSSNIQSKDCQCYSLVLTNEKGDRKFGYCRRVVPEATSVCLPLTYCIISSHRATGFYHKVLEELESRHGLPFTLQEAFVKELYSCKFPQPGESIQVSCLLRSVVINSCKEMLDNNNQLINNPESVDRIVNMQNGVYAQINKQKIGETQNSDHSINSDFKIPKNTYGSSPQNESPTFLRPKTILKNQSNTRNAEPQFKKRLGQLFDELNIETSETDNSLPVCATSDFNNSNTLNNLQFPLLNLPNNQLLDDCLLGDVILKRPYDSRLEDVDLTMLFNTLDLVTLLQTFGSLLHERKVVFVSSCLSKLSSCVEALQSILYPFSWQHTFIPVLPMNMLDILSAPLPLIAGVLASHITETLIIEEGIAVNLDNSSVVCYMGDESKIIPKRLQKGLIVALQLVTEATQSDDRSRNVLVSEAFIRMFVEACGCYKQFVTLKDGGQKIFERDLFIKHHQSDCVKLFLEWFTETAMFNHFIQVRLNGTPSESMFEQRCVEQNSEKNSAALLKNSKVTQKMKHFGQRLFH